MADILDTNKGMLPLADGPCTRAIAFTPADNADLPMMARRLFVGTGGDLALVLRDDTLRPRAPVVFKNVAAGTILNLWTRQVWATGTTASNLVALA